MINRELSNKELSDLVAFAIGELASRAERDDPEAIAYGRELQQTMGNHRSVALVIRSPLLLLDGETGQAIEHDHAEEVSTRMIEAGSSICEVIVPTKAVVIRQVDPGRVVLPDGWAAELGTVLAEAFSKTPPPQIVVENQISVEQDGPTQIDFQRNPNGTIKSATVD